MQKEVYRNIKVITFLILIILISGCKQEKITSETQEEKITINNIDDCYKYFKDAELKGCLDIRYFDLAVTNKDEGYCQKISDLTIREKCINLVK